MFHINLDYNVSIDFLKFYIMILLFVRNPSKNYHGLSFHFQLFHWNIVLFLSFTRNQFKLQTVKSFSFLPVKTHYAIDVSIIIMLK